MDYVLPAQIVSDAMAAAEKKAQLPVNAPQMEPDTAITQSASLAAVTDL